MSDPSELAPPDLAPPVWVATLDAEGVLRGFAAHAPDAVPEGAVAFDHKPDNACDGRYKWDVDQKRFEPRFEWLLKNGDTAAHNQRVKALLIGLLPRELATVDEIRTASLIEFTNPAFAERLRAEFAALTARE